MNRFVEWSTIVVSTDEIIELLDALETSIAEGDLEQARTHLEELTEAYRRKRAMERSIVAQARAARESPDLDQEARDSLTETMQKAMEVSTTRAELYGFTEAYLEIPDGVERSAVTDAIEKTVQVEPELASLEQTASDLVGSVSVPPTLSVISTAGPGEQLDIGQEFSVGVVLKNVGDSAATGVELSLDIPTGLSAETDSVQIGGLESSVEEAVSVSGAVDSHGDYTVTAVVTSENAGSDQGTIPVSAPAESVSGGGTPTSAAGQGLVEGVAPVETALGAGALGIGGLVTVGAAAYWFHSRGEKDPSTGGDETPTPEGESSDPTGDGRDDGEGTETEESP